MAKKGALANDPKKKATSAPTFKYEENKAAYGGLNEKQQARYNTILANKGRAAANKFLQTASGSQIVMPGGKRAEQPATPATPTPESVTKQGFMGAADLYGGMVERFKGFDPMQAQQQYEPVYSQEMERARQNVMGQFERRNADEFARQQEDVQRQIVERGLDPNSPAAQALYKQLNVRQDLARQEAMSSAEQAAQGIQQQMYGQAMGTATMPYDIYGSTFAPTYMAGVGAQYGQQQLAQQQEYAKELAALENKYRLQQIRATPRGGGGGGMDPFQQYLYQDMMNRYGPQQQQPNPIASGIGGLTQGIGAGITAGLMRGGS